MRTWIGVSSVLIGVLVLSAPSIWTLIGATDDLDGCRMLLLGDRVNGSDKAVRLSTQVGPSFEFKSGRFATISIVEDAAFVRGPGVVTASLLDMLRSESAHLASLHFEGVYFEPQALSKLSEMRLLKELHIIASNLNDDHCTCIGACESLDVLMIYCGMITDASLPALRKMNHLRLLNISKCPLFPKDTTGVFAEKKEKYVFDSNGGHATPLSQGPVSSLVFGSVEFRWCGDVLHIFAASDDQTGRLSAGMATIVERHAETRSVILDSIVLSGAAVKAIGALPKLQGVTIRGTVLSEDAIQICETLEHLKLDGSVVVPDALLFIGRSASLRRLEIIRCRELDQYRHAIKWLCPALEVFVFEEAGVRGCMQ